MPLAFLLIGVVFLVAAVRGDKCDGQQCSDMLFQTLKSDFTGPKNFVYWVIALWIIGAIGYYKPLRPLSNAFLGLVVIVLFLSDGCPNHDLKCSGGFFEKFLEQIGSTQTVQSTQTQSGNNLIDGAMKQVNDILSKVPFLNITGVKL